MLQVDRIEGNSTVSSSPIPSAVAAGRDNVTYRLPKPKPASPVKTTVGDVLTCSIHISGQLEKSCSIQEVSAQDWETTRQQPVTV